MTLYTKQNNKSRASVVQKFLCSVNFTPCLSDLFTIGCKSHGTSATTTTADTCTSQYCSKHLKIESPPPHCWVFPHFINKHACCSVFRTYKKHHKKWMKIKRCAYLIRVPHGAQCSKSETEIRALPQRAGKQR